MTCVEVVVVDGDRKREAFSSPVVSWHFGIKYGPRVENIVMSRKKYTSRDAALRAGERQLSVLRLALDWVG